MLKMLRLFLHFRSGYLYVMNIIDITLRVVIRVVYVKISMWEGSQ